MGPATWAKLLGFGGLRVVKLPMACEFDQEALNELLSVASSAGPAFLERIRTMYGATCQQTWAALEAAMAAGDEMGFKQHAHTLKGASCMVGATTVATLAAELELGAWPGEPRRRECMLALHGAMRDSKQRLAELLSQDRKTG